MNKIVKMLSMKVIVLLFAIWNQSWWILFAWLNRNIIDTATATATALVAVVDSDNKTIE